MRIKFASSSSGILYRFYQWWLYIWYAHFIRVVMRDQPARVEQNSSANLDVNKKTAQQQTQQGKKNTVDEVDVLLEAARRSEISWTRLDAIARLQHERAFYNSIHHHLTSFSLWMLMLLRLWQAYTDKLVNMNDAAMASEQFAKIKKQQNLILQAIIDGLQVDVPHSDLTEKCWLDVQKRILAIHAYYTSQSQQKHEQKPAEQAQIDADYLLQALATVEAARAHMCLQRYKNRYFRHGSPKYTQNLQSALLWWTTAKEHFAQIKERNQQQYKKEMTSLHSMKQDAIEPTLSVNLLASPAYLQDVHNKNLYREVEKLYQQDGYTAQTDVNHLYQRRIWLRVHARNIAKIDVRLDHSHAFTQAFAKELAESARESSQISKELSTEEQKNLCVTSINQLLDAPQLLRGVLNHNVNHILHHAHGADAKEQQQKTPREIYGPPDAVLQKQKTPVVSYTHTLTEEEKARGFIDVAVDIPENYFGYGWFTVMGTPSHPAVFDQLVMPTEIQKEEVITTTEPKYTHLFYERARMHISLAVDQQKLTLWASDRVTRKSIDNADVYLWGAAGDPHKTTTTFLGKYQLRGATAEKAKIDIDIPEKIAQVGAWIVPCSSDNQHIEQAIFVTHYGDVTLQQDISDLNTERENPKDGVIRVAALLSQPVYRPTDTVSGVLVVRRKRRHWYSVPWKKQQNSMISSTINNTAVLTIKDTRSQQIAQIDVQIDAFGKGEWSFILDKDATLGKYTASVKIDNKDYPVTLHLLVEEFRVPEFIIDVKPADDAPWQWRKPLKLQVSARYPFGGAAAQAHGEMRVTASLWRTRAPQMVYSHPQTPTAAYQRGWYSEPKEWSRHQMTCDDAGKAEVIIPTVANTKLRYKIWYWYNVIWKNKNGITITVDVTLQDQSGRTVESKQQYEAAVHTRAMTFSIPQQIYFVNLPETQNTQNTKNTLQIIGDTRVVGLSGAHQTASQQEKNTTNERRIVWLLWRQDQREETLYRDTNRYFPKYQWMGMYDDVINMDQLAGKKQSTDPYRALQKALQDDFLEKTKIKNTSSATSENNTVWMDQNYRVVAVDMSILDQQQKRWLKILSMLPSFWTSRMHGSSRFAAGTMLKCDVRLVPISGDAVSQMASVVVDKYTQHNKKLLQKYANKYGVGYFDQYTWMYPSKQRVVRGEHVAVYLQNIPNDSVYIDCFGQFADAVHIIENQQSAVLWIDTSRYDAENITIRTVALQRIGLGLARQMISIRIDEPITATRNQENPAQAESNLEGCADLHVAFAASIYKPAETGALHIEVKPHEQHEHVSASAQEQKWALVTGVVDDTLYQFAGEPSNIIDVFKPNPPPRPPSQSILIDSTMYWDAFINHVPSYRSYGAAQQRINKYVMPRRELPVSNTAAHGQSMMLFADTVEGAREEKISAKSGSPFARQRRGEAPAGAPMGGSFDEMEAMPMPQPMAPRASAAPLSTLAGAAGMVAGAVAAPAVMASEMLKRSEKKQDDGPSANNSAGGGDGGDGNGGGDHHDGNGMGGEGKPIRMRTDLRELALWRSDVTPSKQKTMLDVPFTDVPTKWRATVLAIGEVQGLLLSKAFAQTKQDLIVKLITPRFLLETDTIYLQTIVNSSVERILTVEANIFAATLQKYQKPNQQTEVLHNQNSVANTIVIPAQGQGKYGDFYQVPRQIEGCQTIEISGQAQEQIQQPEKQKNRAQDGEVRHVPYRPYGAMRWVSYFGCVDDEGFSITLPSKRKPELTKLNVKVSKGAIEAIVEALAYLVEYPYGCLEQTLSRWVPLLVYAHAAKNLSLQVSSQYTSILAADNRRKMHQTTQERILSMQNEDGGFGWFSKQRSDMWMTSYVLWCQQIDPYDHMVFDDAVDTQKNQNTIKNQEQQNNQQNYQQKLARAEQFLRRHILSVENSDDADAFAAFVLGDEQTARILLERVQNNLSFVSRAQHAQLIATVDHRTDHRSEHEDNKNLNKPNTFNILQGMLDLLDDVLPDAKAFLRKVNRIDDESQDQEQDHWLDKLFGDATSINHKKYVWCNWYSSVAVEDIAWILIAAIRILQRVGVEKLAQEIKTGIYKNEYQKILQALPTLIAFLLQHKRAGAWINTRATALAIYAILQYETYAASLRRQNPQNQKNQPSLPSVMGPKQIYLQMDQREVKPLVEAAASEVVSASQKIPELRQRKITLRDEDFLPEKNQLRILSKLPASSVEIEAHTNTEEQEIIPLTYEASLSYYSQEANIPAGDHGLLVERRYYLLKDDAVLIGRDVDIQDGSAKNNAIQNPEDMQKHRDVVRELQSGDLIPIGSKIRVVLHATLSPKITDYQSKAQAREQAQQRGQIFTQAQQAATQSPTRSSPYSSHRYQKIPHILLEDYKLAGCETVAQKSGPAACQVYRGACAHVELRTDRVAFFLLSVNAHTQTLAYDVRAEIAGTFTALPAQISAMYDDRFSGNSNSFSLEIAHTSGFGRSGQK